MLGFLFRGLTADPVRGTPFFDRLTAEARMPGWYVKGKVPDTIDGRFAVLATVTALALNRLEAEGEAGERASVALTERFIHVMESEHRELGVSDPTLGRTVRRLVAMLARRTELWRAALGGNADGSEAARASLYGKAEVAADALSASTSMLDDLARRLRATKLDELEQGKIA